MNSIDTKTLVHAGVELCVIGGITYYLNNKINKYESRIANLESNIGKLYQIIENQDKALKELLYVDNKPVKKHHLKKNVSIKEENNASTLIDTSPSNEENLDNELTEELEELNNSDQ